MSKKDLGRGEGNRVADGASVLGEETILATSPIAAPVRPVALKRREMQNDPRYVTNLDAGIDDARQKSTTRKRMNKEVKPI